MRVRDQVVAEALTWLGTPYHHHGRLKGVGVDCAQILVAVYGTCGLSVPDQLGEYPCDWHMHRSEELYLAGLQAAGVAPTDEPQPGDIALFRFGRTWSHGAILVEPDVCVHAYLSRGVIKTRLTEEPLQGRPVRFFTLTGL